MLYMMLYTRALALPAQSFPNSDLFIGAGAGEGMQMQVDVLVHKARRPPPLLQPLSEKPATRRETTGMVREPGGM